MLETGVFIGAPSLCIVVYRCGRPVRLFVKKPPSLRGASLFVWHSDRLCQSTQRRSSRACTPRDWRIIGLSLAGKTPMHWRSTSGTSRSPPPYRTRSGSPRSRCGMRSIRSCAGGRRSMWVRLDGSVTLPAFRTCRGRTCSADPATTLQSSGPISPHSAGQPPPSRVSGHVIPPA